VDDLLLASHNQEKCWEGAKALLARLSKGGYSFLEKGPSLPARGPIPQVHHFRRTIHPNSREETGHLLHSTKREVQEFLGVAGFSCIWKPGYSSLAKPLYKATADPGKDPLKWGVDQERNFQEIKKLLTSTPAIGLPDIMQPFNLFVRKITQLWGGSSPKW
jgi:hypothetical protein